MPFQARVAAAMASAALLAAMPANARPAHPAPNQAALVATIATDMQAVCMQFNGTADCSLGLVGGAFPTAIVPALEKLEYDWLHLRESLATAPPANDPIAQDGVLSWSGLVIAQLTLATPDVAHAWTNALVLRQNVDDFLKAAKISHGQIVWQHAAPPPFSAHGLALPPYLKTQTPPRP